MNEHVMNVLDRSGHTKFSWNPNNEDEVEQARELFEDKTSAGYKAFRVSAGAQSTRMDEFDPQAREMMLVPHLKGG